MTSRNMRDVGTQTDPSPQPVSQSIMVDKGTQTGPPTRDIGTQTEWKEDAGMPTEPETPSRASLMGLPAELRMQIYEQVLTVKNDSGQPRLRERVDLETDEDIAFQNREYSDNYPSRVPEAQRCDNAVLRVSRQTHEEAIQLFYRVNNFHYSTYVLWPEPRLQNFPMPYAVMADKPFHPSLEWMTNLSVDFAGSDHHNDNKAQIDQYMSEHINLIARTCPKLQVFTLHFMWENGRRHIKVALLGRSLTAAALAAMKVRDLLSIVATAPLGPVGHLGYADLRHAVAPERCWDSRTLEDWPEISITRGCYEGYRGMLHRHVLWRWDLHTSRRPRPCSETLEDRSLRVEELE